MNNIDQFFKSWSPIIKNDWVIKFSIYKQNILIIIVSLNTNQTIIRYFSNEKEAYEYVNYICQQDSKNMI